MLRFDKEATHAPHAILLRLALCALAAWLLASSVSSDNGSPRQRFRRIQQLNTVLVLPASSGTATLVDPSEGHELENKIPRPSSWTKLLSDTFLWPWSGNRTDGQADAAAAEQGDSTPAVPPYRYLNNSWRTPLDFLTQCDDFYPGQIPEDHPMKLHQLFGGNASTIVDANETARLLHAAYDYRAQLENKSAPEPPQYWCPQRPLMPPWKERPRVAIVMTMSKHTGHPFYTRFGEKSVANKRDYANRHGYDFYAFDNELAAPRHKYMGSVLGVLSVLRFYDWVFKVDLDTVLMTPEISLDAFMDPRFDIIGAIDCWQREGMQAGVYLIRNTGWSHMLLLEVFTNSGKGINKWDEYGDQATIRELLVDYWNYRIRNHAKIVSPKLFNTYMHARLCRENIFWEEGDFLAHTTGGGPKGINKDLYTEEFFAILEARAHNATQSNATAATPEQTTAQSAAG